MSAHNLVSELSQAQFNKFPGSDPGTGKALPSSFSGQIPLVIAAGIAETNTLADPDHPGIWLTLYAYSVGAAGTRAVTCASIINVAGNTVITFDDVDDSVTLLSVPYSGNTNKARWEIIKSDNPDLS